MIRNAIDSLRCSKAVSAIEYGVLAAVIVGAVATAATALSGDISAAFGPSVQTKISH